MVDRGNESLGVAVLNLTGTRSAARPAPARPTYTRRPCILCMHAVNNQARDVILH